MDQAQELTKKAQITVYIAKWHLKKKKKAAIWQVRHLYVHSASFAQTRTFRQNKKGKFNKFIKKKKKERKSEDLIQ